MAPHARAPVLFVMPPGGMSRRFPEHLGSAFLRAVLRRAGVDALQYLPRRNPSLRGFANFLIETRPAVLGLTVYESNLWVSRALVRVVRETLPEAVVLVGGPNATFTPDETLDLVGADACVRGAGEGTIVALVSAILGADAARSRLAELLRNVNNLVVRTAGGNVHTVTGDLSSFPAAYVKALDDIPSPFQDGIVSTPEIGYLTARGCNQSCTYCSFAAVSGHRVAFHGRERVLDDLEALQALVERTPGPRAAVDILDDAFTLAPARAQRICEGILARRIRLRLRCETRADRVTPELLRLMAQAGFVNVGFGLESAVPRVLRTIGKVRPPNALDDPDLEAEKEYLARFRTAVASAQACGLDVGVSVMGGLPGETAEDFRTTLDFVSFLGVRTYAHNLLSVLPGTPLHENRRSFGLDAFRETGTGIWRTVHPYPVEKVRALRGSTLHGWNWNAAESAANALCGRPGTVDADRESVWAVVLHRCTRSLDLAEWLRRRLAVDGTVVAVVPSRDDVAEWRAFLLQSDVPFGELIGLVPDGSSRKDTFLALGSIGEHRVRVVSACALVEAMEPVDVDGEGNCLVRIWSSSAPDARVEGRASDDRALAGPGLQVGDSCRLGIAPPRCSNPSVLHVDGAGNVRACLHGPVIGAVTDTSGHSWLGLTACPLPPFGMSDDLRTEIWNLDLASQLSWLFPRAVSASEGA